MQSWEAQILGGSATAEVDSLHQLQPTYLMLDGRIHKLMDKTEKNIQITQNTCKNVIFSLSFLKQFCFSLGSLIPSSPKHTMNINDDEH